MNACKAKKDWEGGSVIYPSTGFAFYNFTTTTTDTFVDELTTKGAKIIVMQGCFLYRTFDAPRHSYFCYYYQEGRSKTQNLSICSHGHFAD
jgi:hypothetical protein